MTHGLDYITAADHTWLVRVLELYVNHDGLLLRKCHARLGTMKVPNNTQPRFQRAIRYFDRQAKANDADISARDIRTSVFTQIFQRPTKPTASEVDAALRASAADFGIGSPEALKRCLLADIDGEAIVDGGKLNQNLYEVANEINLNYAKSILRQAIEVRIEISDHSRRVIRLAKLKGLICNVEPCPAGLRLAISGPLSLLRKTRIYGNALASLLDAVVWCEKFTLTAICSHQNRNFQLRIASGDPLRPGNRPASFDSSLEEKFAAAVTRKLPEWCVVREPEPIETSQGIIFPDFVVHHHADEKQRFFCEIIGYWTKEYLEKKLRQWASVHNTRFVLCMNESLRVNDEDLPDHAPIYFFKKSIDPKALLKLAFQQEIRDENAN